MTSAATLSRRNLLGYSVVAFPLAFAGIPLYLHAPDFYATQGGISLAIIGIILFVTRLFDAVQDPFIGYIGDRFRNLFVPLFICAAIIFCASFYALFHPPAEFISAWLLITLFCATTSFSVMTILLNAVGGLWSVDSQQRTRITVWREAFTLFGIAAASILPAILQHSFEPRAAFHLITLGLIGILVAATACFLMWFERNKNSHYWHLKTATSPVNFKKFFQIPQSMRGFFIAYGISLFASTVPAVLVLFYIRDFLNAEIHTGLFLGLYFLAGIFGMPLWLYLANRFGNAKSWLISMALAIITFAGAFLLKEGDITAYAIICAASGLAFGAELALPSALLGHLIEKEKDTAHTASRFALLAFLGKAMLALSGAFVLPLLDYFSFKPGAANTPQALTILAFLYTALPCLVKVAAYLMLTHWIKKNGADYETNQTPSYRRDSHVA